MRPTGVSAVSAGQASASISAALSEEMTSLVEVNALWLGQPYAALDLSDRPTPERRDEVLADTVPTFRSGRVVNACISTPAGGAPIRSLARSLCRSLGRGLERTGQRPVAKEA